MDINLHLTLKGDAKLINALRDLAAAFAAGQVLIDAKSETASALPEPTAPAAPAPVLSFLEPGVPIAPVAPLPPVTPLPAAPAAPAAPAVAPVGSNGDDKSVAVRVAIQAFSERFGRDTAIKLLTTFGGSSITALDPQHYPAVLDLIAQTTAAAGPPARS